MNIEIANKLVKLRKQAGLSQEELADKLGLSRQAVSKWERAEASPDTDNLICLAKLYNVSLDELLSTEDDIDTIVKEQVKKDESTSSNKKNIDISDGHIHIEGEDGDSVHINDDGIRVISEDGEEVTINGSGIHVKDKDGCCRDEERRRDRGIYWAISGILYVLVIITYVLLGLLLNMWSTMWILFFVPDIIMSFAKSIKRKSAHHFNMVFLALFIFFLVCWVLFPEMNLWHPMWVVFLAIPIYYILVNRIEAIVNYKNGNEKVIDDDDDEDEDDD